MKSCRRPVVDCLALRLNIQWMAITEASKEGVLMAFAVLMK